MIRQTSHHVARQRERFALRTRKAGASFATETRLAGRDLASAVRAEADAWTQYVRESTVVFSGSLGPVALERKVLVRVAHALRSLDTRVRERLDALDGQKKRVGAAKAKRASGAARPVTRRTASASRARARAS